MKRYYTFLVCAMMLLSSGITASAQYRKSESLPPQWLHKLPKRTNFTFSYKKISHRASNPDDAFEGCKNDLILNSGFESGVIVTQDIQTTETKRQLWENGKLSELIEDTLHTTIHTKSDFAKFYIKIIDKYWYKDKSGSYNMTTLFARSELGKVPSFDDVELTDRYGALGLWRSAIIPGWGQFYKGSYLKGGLIMGSTVASATIIIVSENMRASYYKKMINDYEHTDFYNNEARKWENVRNITIGVTIALYVYNLIDAIVTSGGNRIIVNKKNGQNLCFVPVSGCNSSGIAMIMNF